MSGDGAAVLAYGDCFCCKRPFWFDADRVPSIPIDPVSGLPPDLGGDSTHARREPICPACVIIVNAERRSRGQPTWSEG